MSRHFGFLGIIVVLAALAAWGVFRLPTRQGLDVKGGIRMTLRAKLESLTPQERQRWSLERMKVVSDIIQKRIDALGVIEPTVQIKGVEELVVELPGFTDREEALELLKTTARLEFRWLKDVNCEAEKGRRYDLVIEKDEKGEEIVYFRDLSDPKQPLIKDMIEEKGQKKPNPAYLKIIEDSPLIITGDDLESAEVVPVQLAAEIRLNLKPEAQDKFAEATSRYLKQNIAIVLDNRVISAPVVQAPGLREPVITGNFSLKEATRLRDLLNAGALPVALEHEQITLVEPVLGSQAWDKIFLAGKIGTLLVVLFMIGYYLLPGSLAVLALGLYILFSVAIFKSLNVTFSLPAIAGFILSIGMAVDANILIFERVKEELRAGKTLLAAIDAGFKRAFTAIFDSNMCTIATAFILFYFGTGPVKGFATTLALGVAVSFFTAITCTRTLLYALVGLGVHPHPRWFGLMRQWVAGVSEQQMTEAAHAGIDFVGKRKYYYGLSLLLIVSGLIAWLAAGGIKPGIDFAGGTELILRSDTPIQADASQVVLLLTRAGFKRSGVQFAEGRGQLIVHAADTSTKDEARLLEALKPLGKLEVISFAEITPRMRREIVENAIRAVFVSVIFILLYISIRFTIEGGWSGFKFGTCATIALFHDVLVVIGTAAIFGYLLGWQVNSLFVTALLTIIGFSVHDTIVVFDRLRENLRFKARGELFEGIVNKSILQTLARSINTSLTVVLVLIALLVWGSVSHDLRHFYVAMLVGIISGTYSSIFNASPLVVDWERLRLRLQERQAEALRVRTGRPSGSGGIPSRPVVSSSDGTSAAESVVGTATSGGGGKKKKPNRAAGKPPKRKRRY